MRTIKSAISDRLVTSFLKWQEVTTDFVEDLTKSFDGLHELALSQTRSSECQKNGDSNPCSSEPKAFNSDTESFDSVNKDRTNERSGSDRSSDSSVGYINSNLNVNVNVKQLSIGSDRKFEYIKTGVYNCSVARHSSHQNHSHENGLQRVTSMYSDVNSQNGFANNAKRSYFTNILPGIQNSASNTTIEEKCYRHVSPETFSKSLANVNQDVMEMNLRMNPKSELLQKVCFIEESKYFFSSQFIENYVSIVLSSFFFFLKN